VGEEFFHTHPDQLWGPPSCTWGTASLLDVKQMGHGINHPLPFSAKVKERVGLYFYSISVPSWQVTG